MNSPSLFSSVLSGTGIFLVAVGLSLLMVRPAFAIEDCDGSCKFGILDPGVPPTQNDCLTVDCGVDEDCYCRFGFDDETFDYYCTCVPEGP